jgi:hypothetical protein
VAPRNARPVVGRVTLAAALGVLLVACSSGGETSEDTGEPTPRTEAEPQRGAAQITYADYERAVLEAIRCIEENTFFEVNGPHTYLTAPGWLTIVPGYHPGDFIMFDMGEPVGAVFDEVMEHLDIADECQSRLLRPTEAAWQRQRAPTEADLRLWYEAAEGCMREHGVELPDDPQPADINSVIDYRLCQPWEALPGR